eukprot:116918-Chlamydomonas_euryale.AAC.1
MCAWPALQAARPPTERVCPSSADAPARPPACLLTYLVGSALPSYAECARLQVIHRRHRTGFEETKDFPIRMNDLIAGRYQVMDFLGSAAFSRAVQALDVRTNTLVCLKIVKNNKVGAAKGKRLARIEFRVVSTQGVETGRAPESGRGKS